MVLVSGEGAGTAGVEAAAWDGLRDWWLERPPASGPAELAGGSQADLEAAALEALPRMLRALPPPPEVLPGALAIALSPPSATTTNGSMHSS